MDAIDGADLIIGGPCTSYELVAHDQTEVAFCGKDMETPESLVVAERVARAVKKSAELGRVDLKDFPLLLHIDEILSQKKRVDIPWEAFTFRHKT